MKQRASQVRIVVGAGTLDKVDDTVELDLTVETDGDAYLPMILMLVRCKFLVVRGALMKDSLLFNYAEGFFALLTERIGRL